MLNETLDELTALKLGPMAARLKQWIDDPANRDKSHTECVLALAQAQSQVAANTRVRLFLSRADLPPNIALDDFRNASERGLQPGVLGNLRTCDWVRRGQAVVITGGAATGKTYLAAALGREATLMGLSVIYRRLPDLLTECAIEKEKGTLALSTLVNRLTRPRLLVLDDFAVERATSDQCHLLRRLLAARARHGLAVMVAASNAVDVWGDYLEDETAAEAIYGLLLEQVKPIVLKRISHVGRQ